MRKGMSVQSCISIIGSQIFISKLLRHIFCVLFHHLNSLTQKLITHWLMEMPTGIP